MAWLTKIVADEQVEYRLKEQAGCAVVEAGEAETVVLDDPGSPAVDYRLRPEGGAALVWMGSGLEPLGLVEGDALDEEGKAAARRIMAGCHPATGARLVTSRTSVRAHEKAQLTTARLVEAIERAAEEQGVTTVGLFDGKPKQLRVFQAQQRNVNRFGEAHRMQVVTLHKLARAAGLVLADVYDEEELTTAWEHKDLRVDDRVRGWDLVLDLPKSDSVLQGLMDALGEQELRDLVHEAKRDTFRQVERWAGYGVGSKDGEPVRVATGGLLAWSVEHQSARPMRAGEPGDPHLHLHVTIANMALCTDGEWRSIANSGQDLHRHASAADAYFKARVRSLTYSRFGVRRERVERTGAWEIRGVPAELRDTFSRRAALVDEKAGADASRTEKQAASMATKRDKVDVDATTMRGSWRERAEAVVGDVDAMVAAAAPGPPGPDDGARVDGPGGGPRIPPPADLAAAVFDPETGLTASEKTFTRVQLLAAVANALEYGLDADPGSLERLCDDVLEVTGYAVRVPTLGSTVMSSTARYTTQDILDAEETVRVQALERFDTGTAQLTADQAAAAVDVFQVAAGYELSAEQQAAVTRVLTAGHGIDALVGVAGAGKSTLMEACRIGWDATGTTYAGATLAAVAAQQLRDASGIPARTVAAWLAEIEKGNGLRGIDVLVVDEATMVDDRAAALLMGEAARTGTKVVGIGDHLQLQAIGPGGWFKETHRLVHGLTLTENRRQEDAAERAALDVWRTGDHELALRMLAEGGRLHPAETADEARSQILTAWDELRMQEWADPHDLIANMVVLAARNSDVDALNLGAQAIRRQAGELGAEHTYALPGGDTLTLAVGDVVRVRANDYRSRRSGGPDMLNGYRAVITGLDDRHRVEITWRVRDAKAPVGYREQSAWVPAQKITGGALSLGYAMTIAASQGLTCNTSLMYGHGANAFATYPGITRARRQNHLWLPLSVLEDERTRARLGEARSEKERLERAIDEFARFLGQSRPDSMVSDLLREPPAPAPQPRQRELSAEEARAESERRLRQTNTAKTARPKSVSLSHRQAENERQLQEQARLDEEKARQLLARLKAGAEERTVPSWRTRVYGTLSLQELNRRIAEGDRLAAEAEIEAAKAETTARELAARLDREQATGQPTRGQRFAAEAGQILDEAETHLATAQEHERTATAAVGHAEDRTSQLAKLAESEGRGRLALRLAGTSLKEHRELTQRLTAERAAYWNLAADARRDARQALDKAWETIRDSQIAQPLGAAGQQVPDRADTAVERFLEMRSTAARHGHSIDKRDRDDVSRATRQAGESRKLAASCRAQAAHARTENALRGTIAEKFPDLHDRETTGRLALRQEQPKLTVQHQRASVAPPQPTQSREQSRK
ncbi:relaxase domain-containing protein [Streptomyces sp. RK23]|uniref:MobF family relaxase n=1 Tax=unclassified Streptomyces TaxID=2593676 RepID=UPI001B364140|nr:MULTISPECIES: MobF family relaxase [unclassified Streptomyces]MBQ0967484.1 relaxase domain-containing protein [Streptomyces sp. RK74B]MBQ1008070.1 relaxase domain-containing protein [Streptomyces sp. RK23]